MKKTIRTILFVCSIGILVYSGYKLWDIYSEYAVGDKLYEDYVTTFTIDQSTVKAAHVVEDEPEEFPLSIHFDALLEENMDVVSWIYSEDTPINYPVVQSSDNDHYLYRMLDGTDNSAGSIFMDYRNASDLSDLNTIIYGHNMKNETMFGTLKHYQSQQYYEEHPDIYLSTPQEDYKIELVAGYQTDTSAEIFHNLPETTEEVALLFDEVTKRSTFQTNASFQKGDRLITLATCSTGDRTDRYVLIGKMTEK